MKVKMNRMNIAILGMLIVGTVAKGQTPHPAAPTLIPTVGQATSASTAPISIQGPHARTFSSAGPVYKGDVINSVAAQTVKVKFSDGSEIWVAPQTNFTIQEFYVTPAKRDALFHVESGSIRALVAKRNSERVNFIMHTKSATMGVRGTEFVVETDKTQKTSLYTLEGSVAIAKSVQALNEAKSTRVVDQGKSSFCTPAQAIPSASKKFNVKELMAKLQKISPEIASDVKDKRETRVKAAKEAKASKPKKSDDLAKPTRKPKAKVKK